MRMVLLAGLTVVFAGLVVRAEDKKDDKKEAPKGFKVKVEKGVAYYTGDDADKVRHSLDLYLPDGAKDFPVFFFVHGGGWRNGSKDGFAKTGTVLAKMGIGCVSTNYRLTGKTNKVKHPDHIKDVARAFAWTVNNIGKKGGNTKHIYISGHSAGGHLVALLGTDESYLKEHKLTLANIAGVFPISGVFSVNSDRMSSLFGEEDSRKKASPLTHVKDKAKLPPFVVFYADKELGALGKQAEAFCKAMKKAGCNCEVKMIEKRDHGTIMRNTSNADDPVTKAIVAFIVKNGGLGVAKKESSGK